MKTLIFFMLVLVAGCSHSPVPETVLQSDYLKLQDSIQTLHSRIDSISVETQILNDSIEDLLVRPMMTSKQFLELYRYYSLKKYYLICKKNPTQWKFYKGWSTQVFEQ